MAAVDTITTYTLKNASSTASLSVTYRGDGSIRFTGASGRVHTVTPQAIEVDPLKDLLDAVAALV